MRLFRHVLAYLDTYRDVHKWPLVHLVHLFKRLFYRLLQHSQHVTTAKYISLGYEIGVTMAKCVGVDSKIGVTIGNEFHPHRKRWGGGGGGLFVKSVTAAKYITIGRKEGVTKCTKRKNGYLCVSG